MNRGTENESGVVLEGMYDFFLVCATFFIPEMK